MEKEKINISDDLLIECSFAEYDEGNRALRYIVGFGAGTGEARVQIYFVDKENKDVAKFDITSHVMMGIFGESDTKMIGVSARKIADEVKKYYAGK